MVHQEDFMSKNGFIINNSVLGGGVNLLEA
jgi:hypothetical protein